jgi:hypothetical protein
MLRTVALLVGLLCSSGLLAGECIDVQNSEIKELGTEYGITTAEWIADIRNHCDEPYDATLTIKFLDDDGAVVHESLEVVIIESRGMNKTRHAMSIPKDQYSAIQRTEVTIEERARPI